MTGPTPRLSVCIVTRDDAADLPACLAAVAALETRPLEVVVVDCASGDGSVAAARAFEPPAGVALRVVPLAANRGFAGGMNEALRAGPGLEERPPWVLTLNADARPAPDYAERLIARAESLASRGERVGAVTGRLVRFPEAGSEPRLDACGMVLVRAWRHLDRGSGEVDRGQYDHPAKVFGATGAASLFFREALDDVAIPAHPGQPSSQVFDERYHSFREDAELAFRLRERGWEVLYEPTARCEHRRSSLPETRAAMPPAVNYHSLKNRYLLRADHQTAGNLRKTLLPTLWRDLLALGHVLLRERTSLPAYAWLWRNRRALREHRRIVQGRRTVPPGAIDFWFSHHEVPTDECPVRQVRQLPRVPGRPRG